MTTDIDQLRREWTDRRVLVESSLPVHRRFLGKTAVVKTVNHNGQALIQLEDSVDITWYDINPAYLRDIPTAPVAPPAS